MKKDYKKPEIKSTEVLFDELMNVTSNIGMGGTTNVYDAPRRQVIYEDEEDELEDIW